MGNNRTLNRLDGCLFRLRLFRRRQNRFRSQRFSHHRQRDAQRLTNRFDVVNAEVPKLFWREILFHIHLVLCRQNHCRDPGTFGSQNLLFDASNRKHVTAERYLASHRRKGTDVMPREQRYQRGRHGHARRRTVLGNRARRHVHVNVVIGEEILCDSKIRSIRSHPGQCSLHGFLHHLADLTGHGESTFAFHGIGFDEQYVASRGCPGQTYSHAGTFRAFFDFTFGTNLDATQEFLNDLLRDYKFFGLAFGQPPRLFTADGSDGSLQAAHTGFAGVVTYHITQSIVGKFDLLRVDSILLHLPRHQIAPGDVQFFFLAVTLEFNDLHTIAQRFGDRIEHIRRGDE